MASFAQIKIIHTLKGVIGLENDLYKDILFNRFGVNSSKDLTFTQAKLLVGDLEKKAIAAGVWDKKTGVKKYDNLAGRKSMASPKQLRMIEAMWADVSRATTDNDRKKALRNFLKRIVGVEDLKFLDSVMARKVIKAIANMKK